MTVPDYTEEKMLPKEPLDLPRPLLDLPLDEKATATTETPTQEDTHDVTTLISWHAPGRPFQKKGKAYFINMLLIMLAVLVILFLFAQYMLMLVIVSLVFLAYALAVVPPHDFYYRVSTEGIMVEDHFFLWQELYDFYFKTGHAEHTLHIRTKAYFPGELTLTLGDIHIDQIKSVILPYLPFREYVKPTSMEKYGAWLSKTFPLDTAK